MDATDEKSVFECKLKLNYIVQNLAEYAKQHGLKTTSRENKNDSTFQVYGKLGKLHIDLQTYHYCSQIRLHLVRHSMMWLNEGEYEEGLFTPDKIVEAAKDWLYLDDEECHAEFNRKYVGEMERGLDLLAKKYGVEVKKHVRSEDRGLYGKNSVCIRVYDSRPRRMCVAFDDRVCDVEWGKPGTINYTLVEIEKFMRKKKTECVVWSEEEPYYEVIGSCIAEPN